MKNKVVMDDLRLQGFPETAKYLPAIYSEARYLAGKYHVMHDYQDVCQIALIEAVRLEKKFNLELGNTFMSFIKKPIRHAVQKVYGYSKADTNKYNKVIKFMRTYQDKHEILPSTSEIAKALSITEVNLKSIYFGKPFQVSLDSFGDTFVEDNDQVRLTDEVNAIFEMLSTEDATLIHELFIQEYTMEELSALYKTDVKTISTRVFGILEDVKGEFNV